MVRKIVWLYGLAGAGKSTIAGVLDRMYGATVVDSDMLRHAWPELRWTQEDKLERARRLLRVAVHMTAGSDRVVVACITPHKESREAARSAAALLVHVRAAPGTCARRKPELYERAVLLAGKDAPFQSTEPDLSVDGEGSPSRAADAIARKAGWV
jgi:adenylylsulfate kinase-like enzyme